MYVEVMKPFRADRELTAGEVLDASDWRLLRQLIAQRYVRQTAAPAPVKAGKEKTNG